MKIHFIQKMEIIKMLEKPENQNFKYKESDPYVNQWLRIIAEIQWNQINQFNQKKENK
jgi:hypothetical protein